MNSSRYPLYAIAIVLGAGIALWAGLPPFLLILLVACPLMMLFMMRGMGGMDGDAHGHGGSDSSHGATQDPQPARPSDLDGSHERIDRP